MKKTPPHLRFWTKADKTSDDGCWLWRACSNHGGYGLFGIRSGRLVIAHRYAWELVNGPIPDGLYVLHRCDTPACVNPAHLFLGTAKDNMLDELAKGRHPQTQKTHCPKGHPYDDRNTAIEVHRGHRSRRCRKCHSARVVAAKKAKQLARSTVEAR